MTDEPPPGVLVGEDKGLFIEVCSEALRPPDEGGPLVGDVNEDFFVVVNESDCPVGGALFTVEVGGDFSVGDEPFP